MTVHTVVDSPVGELLLVGEESDTARGGIAVTSLTMPGQRGRPKAKDGQQPEPEAFAEVIRQLEAYFAGELKEFDLEFRTHGSEFQERVWKALDAIPHGTTTTYGALAEQLGVPRAEVRDVGAAIGANPLLVLRPCHRVIGADGTLKGYAGGVERKRRLLVHEGALPEPLV